MEDDSLYCLELTEKAFRSQGLALSEPVRIGDWEYLASFPLTALLIPPVSGLVLDRPITLEQPVYVPGNERHGVWASPLLETVFGPAPKVFQDAAPGEPGRLNLQGRSGSPCLHLLRGAPVLRPASRTIALRPGPSDDSPWAPQASGREATTAEPGN